MLERLQKKWNVDGWRLLLILITFAVGGSLTGYVGKKILNMIEIESTVLYVLLYIIIMTLIWPVMVLFVSILTGQLSFFRSYLARMVKRK
jgi:hypothetical protein